MSSLETPKKRKRESEEANSSHDDIEIVERAAKRSAITLADFKIHCNIGQGSFGKVVLASVTGEDRMMAIKIIKKDPLCMESILRERRILRVATGSPFVCRAHAGFQSEEDVYLTMDYLPGGSLQTLINTCKYLKEENVQFYTAEIVCGLQYLHLRGIVHRDIKPDNIMLDHDGHVKLIDLGLAQDGLYSDTTEGWFGSLFYMAPEIILCKAYGKEVDWWSLGISVCEMLSGEFPFHAGSDRRQMIVSITNDTPSIPDWLSAVSQGFIKKLLNKSQVQRLGASGDIRAHSFFDGINWKELEERRMEPPFRPFLKDQILKKHPPVPATAQSNRWLRLSFRTPSWT